MITEVSDDVGVSVGLHSYADKPIVSEAQLRDLHSRIAQTVTEWAGDYDITAGICETTYDDHIEKEDSN